MPVELTKRRFDVDDYHRMAQAGILSEDDRVELVDGVIVTMTPIGPRHNAAVDRATRALVTAVGDGAIVQVQGAVRLDRFRELQPDLVLLRPQADFYASRLPGSGDILLVIEVAESSLQYDGEVKGRISAQAGIPKYWLVDLDARVVACHTAPSGGVYQEVRRVGPGESIAPQALPGCPIAVDALLAE